MSAFREGVRVVYVIGGMGSGKSSFSKALASEGVEVLDLDAVGHRALEDAGVVSKLREAFGPGIFDEAGAIDRKRLAKAAFADSDALLQLNEATTSFIVFEMLAWIEHCAARGCGLCVVEVSAFDGPGGRFPEPDETVAIVAPLELRVARAVAAGYAEIDVRARIGRQPSDEARAKWADVVFENDGPVEELARKAREWLSERTGAAPND